MRALLTILSLGTGVALLAAPARADIAPDPDSVNAHCTKVEQCADGVLCEYAWSPGGKPGESEKVGADCRMQAVANGLEERCRNGGNYRGETLHCPKGATGTWSPGGVKPAPTPAPTPVPAPVPAPVTEPPKPVAEPVTEPVKGEPAKSEVKSGCSVDAQGRPGWLLVALVGVLGLRRRRG